MTMKYRIAWKSIRGDSTGHGEAVSSKALVEKWVMTGNQSNNGYFHWVEAVPEKATSEKVSLDWLKTEIINYLSTGQKRELFQICMEFKSIDANVTNQALEQMKTDGLVLRSSDGLWQLQ